MPFRLRKKYQRPEKAYVFDPACCGRQFSVIKDNPSPGVSVKRAQREITDCAMTYGDAVMRYSVTVKGDQPEGGYPLYIALHGGGSADTPARSASC